MDIYAEKGTKVRFLNYNGRESDLEYAQKYLKPNAEYTVNHTIVSGWSTDVILEEFPGIKFNSVMFEDDTEREMHEEVYYRILRDDNGELSIVCMQWFDEKDYDQDKFERDQFGNIFKLRTEKEAQTAIELLKLEEFHKTLRTTNLLANYISKIYNGKLLGHKYDKDCDLYRIVYTLDKPNERQFYIVNISVDKYNEITREP